jgi:hypothetical protein
MSCVELDDDDRLGALEYCGELSRGEQDECLGEAFPRGCGRRSGKNIHFAALVNQLLLLFLTGGLARA